MLLRSQLGLWILRHILCWQSNQPGLDVLSVRRQLGDGASSQKRGQWHSPDVIMGSWDKELGSSEDPGKENKWRERDWPWRCCCSLSYICIRDYHPRVSCCPLRTFWILIEVKWEFFKGQMLGSSSLGGECQCDWPSLFLNTHIPAKSSSKHRLSGYHFSWEKSKTLTWNHKLHKVTGVWQHVGV